MVSLSPQCLGVSVPSVSYQDLVSLFPESLQESENYYPTLMTHEVMSALSSQVLCHCLLSVLVSLSPQCSGVSVLLVFWCLRLLSALLSLTP